jgi:CDP-6-deoxy-D-xylo-4-hexulose-3-dehydrase
MDGRNLQKENHVSNKSDDWFTESFRFVASGYNRPLKRNGVEQLELSSKLPNL